MTLPRADALGHRASRVTGFGLFDTVFRIGLSFNPARHSFAAPLFPFLSFIIEFLYNGNCGSPIVNLPALTQSPTAHRGPDWAPVSIGRRRVLRPGCRAITRIHPGQQQR